MRPARPVRFFAAFSAFATVALAPAAPASAGEIENADQILVGTGDSQRFCTVEHPIAENAPPFGVGPCPGVRPGGRLLSDAGGCTFNFLFKGFRLDDLGKPV
ncbi:MAG: hypothetical protein ACRDHM_08115, partial [Actinomycetota bacterium]